VIALEFQGLGVLPLRRAYRMAAVSTKDNKKAKSGNLFPLTLPHNKRFPLIYQELATGSKKLGLGLSEVFPDSSGAIVLPKFCTTGK
jgi:hypothetical protein